MKDKELVYICEPPMNAFDFIKELNESQKLLNNKECKSTKVVLNGEIVDSENEDESKN